MTTTNDPLEAPAITGPSRLRYAQGTLLDTEDFNDEQRYHRGRLARGLEYLFGPGTVAGLDILWRPHASDDSLSEVVVTPGLAIDPLGRLLDVPKARCIRLQRWFESQRSQDLRDGWIDEFGQAVLIADIFVRYRAIERGKTQRFAEGNGDALNAVGPARLEDGFELALVVREEAGARRAALPTPPPNLVIPEPDADAILLSLPQGQLPPIHDRILGLWRDEASLWENGQPPRLREHLQPRLQLIDGDQTLLGRDTSALMLARLAIPVNPPLAADAAPTRIAGAAPMFDETASVAAYRRGKFTRRFVYAFGHLTQPAARGDGP